jgi:DNA-binding response OmpR family regulator
MKELKNFNICYCSNIINEELDNYLTAYSNKSFNYFNQDELIDLVNTKEIHIVITKYNYELLKKVRVLNNQIHIIAFLDELNHTHLLEGLELSQIKFINNLDSINNFIETLKECIKNLDSKNSNIKILENDFIYDLYSKNLFKNNQIVPLTKKAILFLDFLIKNRTRALSYEEINNEVWNGFMTQDALRSLIKEIRKKTYKEIIKNVSGIGYRIDL